MSDLLPVVSVVMPCYNRSHDLLRVLTAYNQQMGDLPFELIAIDDASPDATFQILQEYHPSRFSLILRQQPENRGPASARNLGLELIRAPVVVIVGDDILPSPDFILQHHQAHTLFSEPTVAILGHIDWPVDMPCNHVMQHITGKGAEQFGYYYMKSGQEYDFRQFYTANISLKTAFIKTQEKWFDTDFYYAAFEDVEFGYRLSKKGLRIKYLSQPAVAHYHYHTAHSFSARQFKAGMMGPLLLEKQPELSRKFRKQLNGIRRSVWTARLGKHRNLPLEWLEDQVLRLANFYETANHPFLTEFFLRVFDYYYIKGWIEGALLPKLSKTRSNHLFLSRVHQAHAGQALLPLLNWFLRSTKPAYSPYQPSYQHKC